MSQKANEKLTLKQQKMVVDNYGLIWDFIIRKKLLPIREELYATLEDAYIEAVRTHDPERARLSTWANKMMEYKLRGLHAATVGKKAKDLNDFPIERFVEAARNLPGIALDSPGCTKKMVYVYFLKHLVGMDTEVIAKRLGIAKKTAHNYTSLVKKALKKHYNSFF